MFTKQGEFHDIVRNTLVKDFMIQPAIKLNHHDTFSKVEKTLRENGIKHLPILDDSKKLVGLITLSDLYRTCSPKRTMEGEYVYDEEQLDRYILRNIMTKEPRTLGPDHTLQDALEIMTAGGFGCLPITDDDNYIVGVVTQTDIIRIISKLLGMYKGKKK